MIEAIAQWLSSEKDYSTGLFLYHQHYKASKQGRILSVGGASSKNQKTLFYELSKLSNLKATPPVAAIVQKQIVIAQESKTTDPLEEPIDILKKEQKSIYKMLDNMHSVLPFQAQAKRKQIAFQILSLDDQLKEIYKNLDHYEKHGVLPLKIEGATLKSNSDFSEAELITRQLNIRTYVSRYKRLLDTAKTLQTTAKYRELLEKFQLELDDINKRLRR